MVTETYKIFKNRIYIVLSVFLILSSLRGTSQEFRKLFIGDTLPSITLQNTKNFPEALTHSSQLNGKLTVIDFWSTSCSSCIKAFPKIEELFAQFKDDVQLILVNPFETEDEVMKRMEARHQSQQIPNVPQIYGDKRWLTMFPIQTMPHIVFINSKGIVISQTSSYNLNAKRLKAILKNEQNAFEMIPKLDSLLQFQHDFNNPLSAMIHSPAIDLDSQGDFWSFDDSFGFFGLTYSMKLSSDSTSITSKFVNTPVINLLKEITGTLKNKRKFDGFLRNDRIVWLAHGKNTLLRPDDEFEWDNWAKSTSVNYELTLPIADTAIIHDVVLNDLNLYLGSEHGLKATLTTQNKPCFVIKFDDSTITKATTKNAEQGIVPISNVRELNNRLERMFAELDVPQTFLRNDFQELKVEEVPFLPINSIHQIGELTKCLQQVGILLSVEYHNVDVVVLSQVTQ